MKESTPNVTTQLLARVCQNCGYNYTGDHCPNCGQRFLTGRFTIKESIGWIFDKMFNFERGFFFTIKELIFNTHGMLTQYFNKGTVDYMHPFRFAFLLATVTSIVVIVSGTFESEEMVSGLNGYIEGWNMYEKDNSEKLQFETVLTIVETIKKYFAFILMINIPLYSISTLIIYRSKKLNFAEHLILNCYAYGFTLLISLPLFTVMFLKNGLVIYSIGSAIIYFIGYLYFFKRLFQESFLKSLIKVIGITILTGILSSLMVMLATIVYALISNALV